MGIAFSCGGQGAMVYASCFDTVSHLFFPYSELENPLRQGIGFSGSVRDIILL